METAQNRFAQLRHILHGEPTKEAWQNLYVLLDSYPQTDDLNVAVDYTREHLARWPTSLKMAPHTWRSHPLLASLAHDRDPLHIGLDLLLQGSNSSEGMKSKILVMIGAWYAGKIHVLETLSFFEPPSLEKFAPLRGYADFAPHHHLPYAIPKGLIPIRLSAQDQKEALIGESYLVQPKGQLLPWHPRDWEGALSLMVLSAIRLQQQPRQAGMIWPHQWRGRWAP